MLAPHDLRDLVVKVHSGPELDLVARGLARHHRKLKEDPRLIVRYRLSDQKNVYLLEVLGGFPAGETDQVVTYQYGPTMELMVAGDYFFTLTSPAQFLNALERGDRLLREIAEEVHQLGAAAEGRMLLYCPRGKGRVFWDKLRGLAK